MFIDFNNVKCIKSAMGKIVSVTTMDDEIHKGLLYVIDPLSKTVILTNPSYEHLLQIIPYSSVKSLSADVTDIDCCKSLFKDSNKLYDLDECQERKGKLKDWLLNNQFDVTEEGGSLCINSYNVKIESPYGPDQCFCDNQLILERIQTLINKMIICREHLLQIIPYSSVKSLSADITDIDCCKSLFKDSNKLYDLDECQERKGKLKDWLLNNQFDVTEDDGSVCINSYNVKIESPYGPNQCFCDNQLILERIQTLINKMVL